MTTTLRTAHEQLELAPPQLGAPASSRVWPTDEAAVSRLLRAFGAERHAASLRTTLTTARPGYDARKLPDHVLLREIASCVARGRIHAYRTELFDPTTASFTEPELPKPVVEKRLTWIEIVLKDTEGHPVPGERYVVQLADGTELDGALDDRGRAFIDQVPAGTCKVSFPHLDGADWRRG